MLGYLNDASSAKNGYPAFWGPFALIGEGAARWIQLIVRRNRVFGRDGLGSRPIVALEIRAGSRVMPALLHLVILSRINDLPWNKPNGKRSAWQARCSSIIGRRTKAGRLY